MMFFLQNNIRLITSGYYIIQLLAYLFEIHIQVEGSKVDYISTTKNLSVIKNRSILRLRIQQHSIHFPCVANVTVSDVGKYLV